MDGGMERDTEDEEMKGSFLSSSLFSCPPF